VSTPKRSVSLVDRIVRQCNVGGRVVSVYHRTAKRVTEPGLCFINVMSCVLIWRRRARSTRGFMQGKAGAGADGTLLALRIKD
jgi:hypothetical protein